MFKISIYESYSIQLIAYCLLQLIRFAADVAEKVKML